MDAIQALLLELGRRQHATAPQIEASPHFPETDRGDNALHHGGYLCEDSRFPRSSTDQPLHLEEGQLDFRECRNRLPPLEEPALSTYDLPSRLSLDFSSHCPAAPWAPTVQAGHNVDERGNPSTLAEGEVESHVAFPTARTPPLQLSDRQASVLRFNTGPRRRETIVDTWDLKHLTEHQQSSQVKRRRILPVVRGIQLVSTHELPARYRPVFPFPHFNAVQSKCYPVAYESDENLVMSAPTGSGKTAVLELAMCRFLANARTTGSKALYIAPTKALCAERCIDWKSKFPDVACAELTGDSTLKDRGADSAQVIVTTPEKWDSVTRWRDRENIRLADSVRLVMIDEVHILRDARGAVLEAVISRIKACGSDVRLLALSATAPNAKDVAVWLGRDGHHPTQPAHCETFDESFRPVKLQRHVHAMRVSANDFQLDSMISRELPRIIDRYGEKKPIMVFCGTIVSATHTAKKLAEFWSGRNDCDRPWPPPRKRHQASNQALTCILTAGVAFHHSKLRVEDRVLVETAYKAGEISVICCTSTLAVGVNLPCHLVIVKNTVCWTDEGPREYSDLDIMQMLGRAGRPQYDKSAVAVIITRQEKAAKYEKLAAGQEVLESCLHNNLVEHLNAEIHLGTITDLESAKTWLAGTFLAVRLRANPWHYKLSQDPLIEHLEGLLMRICRRDIDLLLTNDLVESIGGLRCTPFGDAMARFCVKLDTMKAVLTLPPRAEISRVLSVLVRAEEFREIRWKNTEKSLFQALNSRPEIRFPIRVNLALSEHKRSLLIQSKLGSIEDPAKEISGRTQAQFGAERNVMLKHGRRIARCLVACQVAREDGPGLRAALELANSLQIGVWENTAFQMQQIPALGPVSVRRLIAKDIRSLEDLEMVDPQRVNMILGRNTGTGEKIIDAVRQFPKLMVHAKLLESTLHPPDRPRTVKIRAEYRLLNERPPTHYNKRPLYVLFFAERSDGMLAQFRRHAMAPNGFKPVEFTMELTRPDQHITCHVLCEGLGGTVQEARVCPRIPRANFTRELASSPSTVVLEVSPSQPMNISRRMSRASIEEQGTSSLESDHQVEWEIPDSELLSADANSHFTSLEEFEENCSSTRSPGFGSRKDGVESEILEVNQPQRLGNGRWACNHRCRVKGSCKHSCCINGMKKPPKLRAERKASQLKSGGNARLMPPVLTASNASWKPPTGIITAQSRSNNRKAQVLDLTGPSSGRPRMTSPRRARHWQNSSAPDSTADKSRRSQVIRHLDTPATLNDRCSDFDVSLRRGGLDSVSNLVDRVKTVPATGFRTQWTQPGKSPDIASGGVSDSSDLNATRAESPLFLHSETSEPVGAL